MICIHDVVNASGRHFGDAVVYNHKNFAHKGQLERHYAYPVGSSSQYPGQTFEIHVPAHMSGAFLKPSMSYLNFTISCPNLNDIIIDGNAFAFIQRLRILQGGTVLSDVDNYGSVVNAFLDLSLDGTQQLSNFLYSGSDTEVAHLNDPNGVKTGRDVSQPYPVSVSIPLLLIGPLSSGLSNYIPLLSLNTPIVIEITLSATTNAVLATNVNA